STLPANPAGAFGFTTSTSVNLSIVLPFSPPSAVSRSISLRPTMPAAPVMRMCMKTLSCLPLPACGERSAHKVHRVRGTIDWAGAFHNAPHPAHRWAVRHPLPASRGEGRESSHRKSAVGEVDLSGRVARLIRRQIHGQSRDLPRRAEPAHRLAVDELLAHRLLGLAGLLCERRDAVVE